MNEKKPFQLQIRYVLLPLLFAIIIYALYLANYLGAFRSVLIEEKTAGPFHFLYKTHTGPYHKINDALKEVETWAKDNNTNCTLTFGEYLDNPETTDEKRLRANVGCVLDQPLANVPDGFLQTTKIEQKYVMAHFDGASSIGPLKVYPRIKAYFQKMQYKFPDSSLEIYEIQSEKAMLTKYFFELQK